MEHDESDTQKRKNTHLPAFIQAMQAAHSDMRLQTFIHIGKALVAGGADDDFVKLEFACLCILAGCRF